MPTSSIPEFQAHGLVTYFYIDLVVVENYP